MNKNFIIIMTGCIAVLGLTSCGSASTDSSAGISETVVSNIVSDSEFTDVTYAEETTISTSALDTEQLEGSATTGTSEEITSSADDLEETAEDLKYDFDSAVDAADVKSESAGIVSSFAENAGVLYKLWQSDVSDICAYGTSEESETAEPSSVLIIAHDNIVDEFNCAWYGAYDSTIEFEESDGMLYAILYREGGSFESVKESHIFVKDSEGKYAMFTPDSEKIAQLVNDKVTITVTDSNEKRDLAFVCGDNSYSVDISGYDNIGSSDDIYCRYGTQTDYYLSEGKLHCSFPYSYMMSDFVIADAELEFDGAEFSVVSVSFGGPY